MVRRLSHRYRVQWGLLFTFVAVRLWLAGTASRPPPANRMRLLAAGAAGLDIQIIVGVLGFTSRPVVALASAILTVVMAVLFCLGLVLPSRYARGGGATTATPSTPRSATS